MSVILIDLEEKCFCTCGTKCINGHTGSSLRCTKKEIESRGYKTLQVADEQSEKAVRSAMVIGEKKCKLKIINV